MKKMLAFGIVLGVAITTVMASESNTKDVDIDNTNFEFIEEAKLSSSRYTKQEDLRPITEEMIAPITDSDEFVTENAQFVLYYNSERVSFKVLNKATNYVWTTHLEDANQGSYDGLLESGIAIEYIDLEKDMQIKNNIGIGDTLFTAEETAIENGVRLSINFGGYCATRACERLYPRYLEGDYTLEEMIEFGYTDIDIAFDFEVTLTNEGLQAHVPYDSIVEQNPDTIRLSSIIVFPALGATKMDEIPGYMMIPDGSGALIRYEDNEGQFFTPFEEKYYAPDEGINALRTSVTNYPLSMPIFGAVHGVNQNGFVGIIESGDMNARLLVYPNGAFNLDYNLIFTKIDFRQTYLQSFNSAGTGGAMRQVETQRADVTIQYRFLDGDDANYVGMGRSYQSYLEEAGVLTRLNELDQDIELFIQYLMADNENSFFGDVLVEMSSVEEVKEMYRFFIESGLNNQLVGLLGWNENGYSGYLPSDVNFENALGNNRAYQGLIDLINEENSVVLSNDYVVATNDTKGISYRRDVAEGVNQFKLVDPCEYCVHTEEYVLYPSVSSSIALDDLSDYQDASVDVGFESLGEYLFSFYDNGLYLRQDALDIYQEIYEAYQDLAYYYYPQAYAYGYTKGFLDAPLYNSQLKYFDDLVPVLQTVLKGYVPMYSDYLNYNSLGQEQILTLIDFGVYPSFLLTHESSSLLKDTDVSRFFTTEYDLWKNTIVEEYDYINNALRHVINARIDARVVHDLGIVEVIYDNGISIWINYSSSEVVFEGGVLPAMDYVIIGGDAS
jgi:hypothetical protein